MKKAKGISQQASSFIIAAERCFESRLLADGTVEAPLILGLICIAFSIELNFKALIISQGGNVERHHNLLDLYNEINESIKNKIHSKVGYQKSIFEAKLKDVSNTFVEWRYLHEQESLYCDLAFLNKLSKVTQELSYELCTE